MFGGLTLLWLFVVGNLKIEAITALLLSDILYFEADGNYLKLCALSGQYHLRSTILAVEEQQSEEVYTLHQSSRKLKHDMKNHLMVLSSYLALGEL